jgi:hypothetical protein
MKSNPDFSRKWEISVHWLQEELERRPFASGGQYNYEWSPPAPSNDSTNSYYLERSPSARFTLKAAYEFLPEEPETQENTEQTIGQEGDNNPSVALQDQGAAHSQELEERSVTENNNSLDRRRKDIRDKSQRNRSDPNTSLSSIQSASMTDSDRIDQFYNFGHHLKLTQRERRDALSITDDGFSVEDDKVTSLDDTIK